MTLEASALDQGECERQGCEGKGRVWDDLGVGRGDWMGVGGFLMREERREEEQVEMRGEVRSLNGAIVSERSSRAVTSRRCPHGGSLSPPAQQAAWPNIRSC